VFNFFGEIVQGFHEMSSGLPKVPRLVPCSARTLLTQIFTAGVIAIGGSPSILRLEILPPWCKKIEL